MTGVTARATHGPLAGSLLAGLLLASPPLWAQEIAEAAIEPAQPTRSRVAIIIDDMGYQLDEGRRAIDIAAPLTFAFLPHTPYARTLARLAHERQRQVMLHAPMQSMEPADPGPGSLLLDMTEQQFLQTLQSNLDAIPHAAGINNHMGSLLTRHPGHMQWLMGAIKRRGNLFFVDSMTTAQSVAQQIAQENRVPFLRRNVFLDHDRDPQAIARQFSRLIALALRRGRALAIGHPYPETLALIEQMLPVLAAQGIDVVPASDLLPQGGPIHAQRTDTARPRL